MSPIGRQGPEQRLELETQDGRKAKVRLPEELQAMLGPKRSEPLAQPRPEVPPDARPAWPPDGAG